MKSVNIIITGGTIEKSYNVRSETMDFYESTKTRGGSVVKEIIKKACIRNVRLHEIMYIDSLVMGDKQRQEIFSEIEKINDDRYVITHGTGTMLKTGEYLESQITDKTVVLMGALAPYRYDCCEASVNFGTAIAAARVLDSGVYIAMHGIVAKPSELKKSKNDFIFSLKNK